LALNILQILGVQIGTSFDEKIIASLGSILCISAVFFVTDWLTNFQFALALLPSMGASAVLLMAVPHGILSQPWPLVGGHVLPAACGVICALLIDNIYLSAGVAVGFAIFVMHLFRCIHPPGGATALVAVIGGEPIHDMGFYFLIVPTLLNCVIILGVALVINNLFQWRRYPSSLMKYDSSMYSPETAKISVSHLEQALGTLDEVVDVAPEQLKYILDKADEFMRQESMVVRIQIKPGGLYTNGAPGQQWSVRRVIDISSHTNPAKRIVIYKTVDGANKGKSGSVLLYEFTDWAKGVMQPVKSRR